MLQHYIKLTELEKNRKLNDLLDALDFNQVVIFVKSVSRAAELNKLLVECNFPSICIHSGMSQEERFVLFVILDYTCVPFLRSCLFYHLEIYAFLSSGSCFVCLILLGVSLWSSPVSCLLSFLLQREISLNASYVLNI